MLCNPFPDLGADNLYDALMTSRPLKGWARGDAETITQYRLKFGEWMMNPEGSVMEIGTGLIYMTSAKSWGFRIVMAIPSPL